MNRRNSYEKQNTEEVLPKPYQPGTISKIFMFVYIFVRSWIMHTKLHNTAIFDLLFQNKAQFFLQVSIPSSLLTNDIS